jgi:uridine kinase
MSKSMLPSSSTLVGATLGLLAGVVIGRCVLGGKNSAPATAKPDNSPLPPPVKVADSDFYVVGICGGSGSGKTTLTSAILSELKQRPTNATVISICMDNYYRPLDNLTTTERAKVNFDHPDALETSLLVEQLQQLKAGKAVKIPEYDFTTHTRKPGVGSVEQAKGRTVIVVEGILLLAVQALVDECDLTVYVDGPADVRCLRRIKRDIVERKRTVEDVVEQYMTTVRPMHNQFVEPMRDSADIVVPNAMDTVTIEVIAAKLTKHLYSK